MTVPKQLRLFEIGLGVEQSRELTLDDLSLLQEFARTNEDPR